MEKDLTIRIDADDMLFRATVENVNEETRTFDVVFATETPVPKMDWNRYVMVDEILEISEKNIFFFKKFYFAKILVTPLRLFWHHVRPFFGCNLGNRLRSLCISRFFLQAFRNFCLVLNFPREFLQIP